MVVARDLHKSFGSVHAVRGVSLELVPGQIAGLLGHNGAGKTTTIRMIAGFLTPDAGQVSLGGQDIATHRAAALSKLGYLPEANPLYPEMGVPEYLDFRARLHAIPRRERRTVVDREIDRCRLSEVRDRRIGALSKGYKQRVGLAAALLHDPSVLLLDEPTNGLDPTQILESRELIRGLAQNRTVLVSSHILPEIERLCDRVVIFAAGRIGADGSPADLARAAGEGVYVMECRAEQSPGTAGQPDRGVMQRALMAIPGIAAVTHSDTGDGWDRWTLTGAPGAADLRALIAQAARTSGQIVRELRTQHASLERVFMRVLEQAGAGAGERP